MRREREISKARKRCPKKEKKKKKEQKPTNC
jgi:hypothetical protein